MKKILFSFVFVFLFSMQGFSADYYFVGVDAFKKGAYDMACSNLEHAVIINPKNVNARYYLAQSYLMQNRMSDATNQYNRIILLFPASDAAVLSQKGLSLIKQAQNGNKVAQPFRDSNFSEYNDNYLDYILSSDGTVKKWNLFPVTVYIEPKKQKDIAKKAFEQWQAKSKGLVSFRFVDSPSAQITVNFKDKLEYSSVKDSYIAGYSKPYYQGDSIVKSEIYILTVDPKTAQSLDDDSVAFSILHEIGHSLGFQGHSQNENDVMYPNAKVPKLSLTQRDLNTLNIFYKIDKRSLLARKTGSTDLQLQQALDYVKKTPDKAVGWANLGDIYRNKKMYSSAVQNYKKAISIEPQKAEYYNLIGSCYSDMGDKQSAFLNLKKACDLDSSNSFYIYQFAQLCLVSEKKDIGRSYLNSYLKANPQGTSDEKIQSLLKSYQ